MKATVIYYKVYDSEFGDQFVIDNKALIKEEDIDKRIEEIKQEISKDCYKTLRYIHYQEITIA